MSESEYEKMGQETFEVLTVALIACKMRDE
jgi:hypothetical protein